MSTNIERAGAGTINSYPRHAQQQILASPEERKRIRANASLPPEAWIDLENTVYPAMDSMLTVVDDLRSAGLTTTTSIQNKSVEWNMRDYSSSATVSMDPDVETEEAHSEYDLDGVPLPVIHADFSVGWRESGSEGSMPGGMGGEDLEVLGADAAGRAVAEAAEQIVLNGWEPTISGEGAKSDGYTLYGLTNHPQAHNGDLADWTTAHGEIRKDLKWMARQLKDDKFRPGGVGYNVYIGEDLEDPLTEPDPDMENNLVIDTITNNLDDINGIRVSDFLDPDAVLMFRPTLDVVDLSYGLEETVVQWEDPFRDRFKLITGFAPRIKQTMRGQFGAAYFTGGTS